MLIQSQAIDSSLLQTVEDEVLCGWPALARAPLCENARGDVNEINWSRDSVKGPITPSEKTGREAFYVRRACDGTIQARCVRPVQSIGGHKNSSLKSPVSGYLVAIDCRDAHGRSIPGNERCCTFMHAQGTINPGTSADNKC